MKSSTREYFEIDSFQEGYLAGRSKVSLPKNPYDVHTDTDRHFDWYDGYIDYLNDQHIAKAKKELWAIRRAHLKERLIQSLYSMAFVVVCFIIGLSLRYLLR